MSGIPQVELRLFFPIALAGAQFYSESKRTISNSRTGGDKV